MLISVVTPSLNQLDFLRCCAASVADQGGDFRHEHLVQDAGSGPEFDCYPAVSASGRICSGGGLGKSF